MTGIQPDVGSKPPSWAGDVVDIAICNGMLYVACQRGVFSLTFNGLEPLTFINPAKFPPPPVEEKKTVTIHTGDLVDPIRMTTTEYEAYKRQHPTLEKIDA